MGKPADERKHAEGSLEGMEARKESLLAQPLDVCGIVGFGLYLAWFYLVLTCSVESSPGITRETRTLLVFVFLLGEALCAIAISPNATRLANRKAICVLTVVASAFCILPGVASLAPLSETVLFASWLVAGVGAVLLLSLWGFFLARLAHRQASAYTALSALVAVCVLCFVRLCFKEVVFPFASVMVAVASAMLFAFWASLLCSKGEFVYPENVRPFDWNSLIHSAVAMVANSFLLGFAFYAISVANAWGGVFFCAPCLSLRCSRSWMRAKDPCIKSMSLSE